MIISALTATLLQPSIAYLKQSMYMASKAGHLRWRLAIYFALKERKFIEYIQYRRATKSENAFSFRSFAPDTLTVGDSVVFVCFSF